jgi:signal transduction histidine kinase
MKTSRRKFYQISAIVLLRDICIKRLEKIPVRMLVSVINYRDDLIGYVIVAQDITNILLLKQEISERRQTEKQLMELMASNKQLLEETLEYDQLKTEFFSNISHELKTPLNVLLSAIQLSEYYLNNKSPIDTSKLIKNNHYMKQNCFRLLKLISNLLDVTKIDSGYFKVNNVNADIIYFIENIIDSIQPYTDEKQINVSFDTNTEDKLASFDPYIIETIILNLLSNALKFTPPKGTIRVNVTSTDELIEITVEDNGVGIPGDKLEIIFERFRQVTPLLTRKHEGSGIGLSLVKSLIEILHGTIAVESRECEGTKFTICIPYILDDKCVTINDLQYYTQNFTTNNIDRILIQFSDIPLE